MCHSTCVLALCLCLHVYICSLQVNSVYNYILFGIASLLFMIPWQVMKCCLCLAGLFYFLIAPISLSLSLSLSLLPLSSCISLSLYLPLSFPPLPLIFILLLSLSPPPLSFSLQFSQFTILTQVIWLFLYILYAHLSVLFILNSSPPPPHLSLLFSVSPLPFFLSGLVNCCCVQYWSNSSEKNVTITIHFCGNVNNDDLNPSSFPLSLSLSLFAPPPPLHTSQVVLLINAAVQFGNVLLLSSYLMFMLLSSLVRFHYTCNDNNNNYYWVDEVLLNLLIIFNIIKQLPFKFSPFPSLLCYTYCTL